MTNLKYFSEKENSVERGSKRIPLFFQNEVVQYFKGHTLMLNDLTEYIQELDNPEGINLCDTSNEMYAAKVRDLREYKGYVLNKLDEFTLTALDLIEDHHDDMVPCYVEELVGAMNIVRGEVETWDKDLPKTRQQSIPYIV